MNVIEVKNLYKKFRIHYDKGTTLKEKILFRNRNNYEDKWVLKGIDLNIEKGETVGLIGENGSGKSTLLKLLTKIIYPDKGTIEIKGKVSSLLELGAGFHPDMSGRENIYMNASIFGLTKEEIDNRLDDIIEFSELQQSIDNPVRTYSSGMYMRLAFSVAINVKADILLIDEILAVGDITFQKKCFDKILELKSHGKTIVIVSHDTSRLKKICDKAVWIVNGKIQLEGISEYVIDKYVEYMYKKNNNEENKAEISQQRLDHSEVSLDKEQENEGASHSRWGGKEMEFIDIKTFNSENKETVNFKYGESLVVLMKYKSNSNLNNIIFGFEILTADGVLCYGTNTELENIKFTSVNNGVQGEVRLFIENLYLTNGIYYINLSIHSEDGYVYDFLNRMYSINVYSSQTDLGIFKPVHRWMISN